MNRISFDPLDRIIVNVCDFMSLSFDCGEINIPKIGSKEAPPCALQSEYTSIFLSAKRKSCFTQVTVVVKCLLLCSYEAVLDNSLVHFTSPENHLEIFREGILRGSHVPGYYDGILADASSPPRNYFRLTLSTSDGIHFPFSTYPHSVEPGGQTMRLFVNISQFFNDENYRMYYVGATPSQRGPNFSVRVHSHVVFAPREHWAWADENLVLLDKESNAIAQFTSNHCKYAQIVFEVLTHCRLNRKFSTKTLSLSFSLCLLPI